jgi:hypothetical protein
MHGLIFCKEGIPDMKKLLMCLCVLMALLLAGCGAQKEADVPVAEVIEPAAEAAETAAEAAEPTAEAGEPTAEVAEPAAEVADPAATENPMATAQAFLIVRVGLDTVFAPIPLTGEQRLELKRGDKINIIETTADSICMAESSCDNQDCVFQGVVSLQIREKRVLQNLIICLPNEVTLELYTREEIEQMLPGWLEEQK